VRKRRRRRRKLIIATAQESEAGNARLLFIRAVTYIWSD